MDCLGDYVKNSDNELLDGDALKFAIKHGVSMTNIAAHSRK